MSRSHKYNEFNYVTKRHKYYFCSMDPQEYLQNGEKYFLPNLSIDVVIIGYEKDQLKCLMLKMGDKWMLPGGHIFRDESVEDATGRILLDRVGIQNPHMKFLSVFGKKDRKFHEEFRQYSVRMDVEWDDDSWMNDRFVTLAYYSLVDINKTHPVAGQLAEAVDWFDFEGLPEIWMDHHEILDTARNRLKEDVRKELITYNLLPSPFTMPELHNLHQTILQEKIDRSRFQKKMLSSDLFERLPKLQKDSPGRNPYLYKLKSG